MEIFQIALMLATLLCSLVAGFLFAFAIVVMPGIKNLNDKEFIRAFQVIDGGIQNNQPIFMVVWVGSVLVLITSVVLSIGQLDSMGRMLIISATFIYIFGVQVPTGTINVPLNNKLQTLDLHTETEATYQAARDAFELRWNRWNKIRTVLSILVTVLLLYLLFIM